MSDLNYIEQKAINHIKRFHNGEIVDEEIFEYYRNEIFNSDLSNKKILDLGCGDGSRFIKFLLNSNAQEIIGIDISEIMLNRANNLVAENQKNSLPKIKFIQLDFTNSIFPFENEYFDIITSTFSFKLAAIPEISRVLKDNGYFYIGDGLTEIKNQQKIDEIILQSGLTKGTFKFPLLIDKENEFTKSKIKILEIQEYIDSLKLSNWKISNHLYFSPKRIKIDNDSLNFSDFIEYKQVIFKLNK